jgi:hypothetical protein
LLCDKKNRIKLKFIGNYNEIICGKTKMLAANFPIVTFPKILVSAVFHPQIIANRHEKGGNPPQQAADNRLWRRTPEPPVRTTG